MTTKLRRYEWTCPVCRRRYAIPVGHNPEQCPKCDAADAAERAEDERTSETHDPLPLSNASPVASVSGFARRKKRWHPAKVLMLVATAAWPVATVVLSVVFYSTSISGMADAGGGRVLDYSLGAVVSRSSVMVRSFVSSAFIVTALYLASMFALLVVWFATKTEEVN